MRRAWLTLCHLIWLNAFLSHDGQPHPANATSCEQWGQSRVSAWPQQQKDVRCTREGRSFRTIKKSHTNHTLSGSLKVKHWQPLQKNQFCAKGLHNTKYKTKSITQRSGDNEGYYSKLVMCVCVCWQQLTSHHACCNLYMTVCVCVGGRWWVERLRGLTEEDRELGCPQAAYLTPGVSGRWVGGVCEGYRGVRGRDNTLQVETSISVWS